MSETDELDVITIIGLPGQGKTTLASKVFDDPKVQTKFQSRRIWVKLSHKDQPRDVLQAIFRKIPEIKEGTSDMTGQEMADILRVYLGKLDSFFIVMDDVCSAHLWTDLEKAFPTDHKAGKILMTTQDEEVARRSKKNRAPHKLRLLTHNESWTLLKLEVFKNSECPEDLHKSGKLIANKCEGLPLLIVVVGEILVRNCIQASNLERKEKWEKMSKNLSPHINEDGSQNILTTFSSYNKLPYHLRPCFLYLGIFPEEFPIPVGTLVKLWIAEGFVKENPGERLEETARGYLDQLINRNLVMIVGRTADGQIKLCRVHYMLREFCKREAGIEKENIFQEMKYSTGGAFQPQLSELQKHRRLCMDSNFMDFLSKRPCPSCPRVRSFLCFSKERDVPSQLGDISNLPAIFKLLRVLDTKPISIKEIPNDWKKLVHLRYVVLSSDFKFIPKVIAKLWNMQTLIVYTTSPALEVKANVWKMDQLRHVKTNVPAILPSKEKSKDGNNLQTLGTISHLSCTADVFDRLCRLQKLSICGRLDMLLEAKVLHKLLELKKLKLKNDGESSLSRLPNAYEFPPKLKRLTLCGTGLEWDHMATLGNLDKLEVLKLKDKAFIGRYWKASAPGFSELRVLHMECCDIIIWEASGNPFPKLTCLVLRNCKNLEEIPETLGESLEKLVLDGVKETAADSARTIKSNKEQQQGQESSSGRARFQLIINSVVPTIQA